MGNEFMCFVNSTLPYLTVRQRLAEGGHSGKANAVSNLPVCLSLGIILYAILGTLGRFGGIPLVIEEAAPSGPPWHIWQFFS